MQQLPVTHLPSTQQQNLQCVLFGTHLYSKNSHKPYTLLSKALALCSLVVCAKENLAAAGLRVTLERNDVLILNYTDQVCPDIEHSISSV